MQRMWRLVFPAATLVFALGAGHSQAGQTLTYSFSGEVSQIREFLGPNPLLQDYGISLGTPLVGTLTYDPSVPDHDPDSHYGFYPGAAVLSYTVGTLSYSSAAWIAIGNSVSSLPLVSGERGYDTPQGPFSGDWMIVRGDNFNPFGVVSFALKGSPGYGSNAGNVWNTDAFPASIPNGIIGGGILTNMIPGSTIIDIDISQVIPVPVSAPEPSTFALACSAIPIGLGLFWRRRRAA